ncbi:MAG: manganese efflux pump [Christensenellaceae bacterium]|nr:manganese efflux pump [Christensenellaceae bacterium]
MGIFEILLVGVGLSMDACAVSMSNGMVYRDTPRIKRMAMPVFFGVFQAVMPLLGFFAGNLLGDFLNRYAGIVTLLILGVIGGKMLYDGIRGEDEADGSKSLTWGALLLQAVATSIDAFAVGVSFCAQQVSIALAVCLIGITTFLLSLAAMAIGKKCGDALGSKAQILGGIILIIIGIKSLF